MELTNTISSRLVPDWRLAERKALVSVWRQHLIALVSGMAVPV